MTVKITSLDLGYILTQIQMAEAGQAPVNPLLSFGLREIQGTNNNLAANQGTFGSALQPFPTLTDPVFQSAQFGTSYSQTSGLVIDAAPRMISQLIATQDASNPAAVAAQQHQLSQLGDGYRNLTMPGADGLYGTADDTVLTPGPDGIAGTADDVVAFVAGPDGKLGTADDLSVGNAATPTNASDSSLSIPGIGQSLFIPNITPDNGLSAPANSFFTFFGQFFDHGLDLITKNPTSGEIFIPLQPGDPLYNPNSPQTNFMVETRAQDAPGPDGILGTADDVHEFTNQITPFVDQSQTYGSDPSHDVFLRAYMIGADGQLHSTGGLLGGTPTVDPNGTVHTTMATWGELKTNALTFFGIKLTDYDVDTVPLLATDAYGNFMPGAHGLPQLVVTWTTGPNAGKQGLVEGNLKTPVGLGFPGDIVATDQATGWNYTATVVGTSFIDDKAVTADPFAVSNHAPLAAELPGQTIVTNPLTGDNNAYDANLLNQHFVGGDGRVNENIGLTAIQNLFHAEHDRLLAQIKTTIQQNLNNGDISFAADWVLPGVVLTGPVLDAKGNVIVPATQIADSQWNGERLFQAAKFGTETEYQHIVFDEFARYVAPAVHVAGGVNVHIDAAITSEFANVVYRFGHSMLDENIPLYQLDASGHAVLDASGQPVMTQEGLIAAFTNPTAYANTPNLSADLILGTVNQISDSIDEFVTGSLQDNLLGQPLDLASLNIARGRDTGVAPLNLVRNQLFQESGESQLKPYTSWMDFASELKHPESLVNFIAAYGTYSTIVSAVTAEDKRVAAQALVNAGTLGSATFSLDAYNYLNSQGSWANNKNSALAIHDSTGAVPQYSTGSITGVDDIDFWIGGLAEQINLFGGVLGSTFEYVFRTQMEALQDGDRLYYLPRIEGTDYEDSLQDSSLAQMIRANTDIKHLPGNIFITPEYTIEATDYFVTTGVDANGNATFAHDAKGNMIAKDPNNANNTWLRDPVTGQLLMNITPDGTLQFLGNDNFLGNTIILGGTEDNDKLIAGAADDDTLWGDGGNDMLDGGNGADFLFGGTGDDTLYGGAGADELHGDTGNDTIYGGNDIDTIFGGDGNDYIEGGRGDDVITGGLGNDIIIGNEGFDALTGDEGDDWLESDGGQGQLMFGDSGAPTGQQALYSGNDVMVGGVAGGDIMKGFSGDDIMLGHGSFTKFEGDLGFDWGSYEQATQGVDEDMNRKEFVAANGAVDNIRDIWQHTEGASGSAFDDIILGDNASKLLTTKDELDNVNLIAGLAGFFDPGVVSFSGGNILLGGAGNDTLTGGGGNDIIDGDAWLHVGLTSYSANGQILRQILYDPNGNTYDPTTAKFSLDANGNVVASSFVKGTGNINPTNVDVAVYNGPAANYDIALFGPDAEGFLTIQQIGPTVVVGANPQGILGAADDTDRIRHIERLQFADGQIAITPDGKEISSSFAPITDPNYAILYAPFYDAVPFGTPTLTETDPTGNTVDPTVAVVVGNTLTGSIASISDYDNIFAGINATGAPTNVAYQWQYNDVISGQWVDYAGAIASTFKVTNFLVANSLGVRLKISYVDGKGYTEQLFSAPTFNAVTLPGNVNTAPFLVPQTQFNGIASTSATVGQTFDFFSPFTSIFADTQTAADQLIYKATLADGSPLANANLQFKTVPGVLPPAEAGAGVSLAGEFSTLPGIDPSTGLPFVLGTVGQIAVRVIATDPGGLSVTSNFIINVLPPNSPPVAVNDTYTTLENVGLQTLPSQSVLHNDVDPNNDPFTAKLVTGPSNGTLTFNADGTFVYVPNLNFSGTDSFTYQDTDSGAAVSNIATATINVNSVGVSIAATNPAGATSLTATFNFLGQIAPGTLAFTWDSSTDGINWTPIQGATSATFQPAVTTGVFLRSDATFVDANTGLTHTVTSNPVRYVLGTPAADTITGGAITTIIFADAGNDVITAGTGPMFAYGGDGNDTFKASVGAKSSTYDGQGGVNTYDLSATSAAATVSLIAGSASSTQTGFDQLASIQNVIGGSGGDVIIGDANANVITGGLGNDIIDGGAGNDSFIATVGDGNDSYQGGAGNDTYDLSGTTAAATVNLGKGTSTSAQTGTDTLSGVENVIGTAANDTITGSVAGGVFIGGAGADTITGGAGNDTFIATLNDGNDTYNGGTGIDTLDLSATTKGVTVQLQTAIGSATGTEIGTDVLTLASFTQANGIRTNFNSIENVIGGSGNDNITGDGSNNVLIGGAGNDFFNGMAGADTMIGGTGDDTYMVDNVGDQVVENAGEGTDTVQTTLTSYTLGANLENLSFLAGANAYSGVGNAANNIMRDAANGNNANTTLDGQAGNDTLITNGGNDVLIGGLGNDTMTSGTGNDIFRFQAGFGNDTITDFGASPGNNQDILDISSFVTAANFATAVTLKQVTLGTGANTTNAVRVTVLGGGAAGGTITLNNHVLADITQTDFKLG